MDRIRHSIHSLLSRSSKKNWRFDDATVGREEQVHKVPETGGKKSGNTNTTGFNVFQARIYTKGERNNYHYSPIPNLPTFRFDPPDDIPFRLGVVDEQYPGIVVSNTTPPASPTQGRFRKPPPRIDTRQVVNRNTAPPSPPDSPSTQDPEKSLSANECEYQSPTRAPPCPPITNRSPLVSPFLNASDDILIHIFSHLDSPSSMESLGLANSRFHAVLTRNKLFILRGIVNNTSPSAYCLVDFLNPGEPVSAKSYSENYAFSLEIVHAIKSLIQSRCRFFLTSDKMDFHNDRAEKAFDDALYNIWTFCTLFRDQVERVEKQMRWLRKFSSMELLDILEIWQCLGVLLRPLIESPELARKHGVIQKRPSTINNPEVLVELGEKFSLASEMRYCHPRD